MQDFCRTSAGLLKDFWRTSEGFLKDFQRTYKSQPTGLRDLLDQNCTESLIKFISVVQVSLLLLLKVSTDKSSRNLTKSILNAIRGLRAQTGRKMSETSGFSFCWVKDKCVSCCWVLMMVMYEKRSIYTTVRGDILYFTVLRLVSPSLSATSLLSTSLSQPESEQSSNTLQAWGETAISLVFIRFLIQGGSKTLKQNCQFFLSHPVYFILIKRNLNVVKIVKCWKLQNKIKKEIIWTPCMLFLSNISSTLLLCSLSFVYLLLPLLVCFMLVCNSGETDKYFSSSVWNQKKGVLNILSCWEHRFILTFQEEY